MRANTLGLVAGLTLLAACANQTPAEIATDVANIATGVASAAATLREGDYLTPAQLVTVDNAVSAVQAAALALANAQTSAAKDSAVEELATDVNAVDAALSEVPSVPSQVRSVLSAAEVLLPVVEAAFGVSAPFANTAIAMTPSEARAILGKEAAKFHGGH